MSNKRIEINPALFSMNGGANKTKKKREKPIKPAITTLISPNVLKNKLLKRIKEHKNRENTSGGGGGGGSSNATGGGNIENNKSNKSEFEMKDENISKYTDEFNDSISYLQSLSKQKKVDDEKLLYEKQKEKRREELQRSTLKNYSSYYLPSSVGSSNPGPFVYNELPEDLKEPLIRVDTANLTVNNIDTPISLKYKVDNIVPYGVLKGGMKPTMREWNKTQKNRDSYISTNTNTGTTSSSTTSSERENKLNILKEKIKEKQRQQQQQQQQQQQIQQNQVQIVNESPQAPSQQHVSLPIVAPQAAQAPQENVNNVNNNDTQTIKQICKKNHS